MNAEKLTQKSLEALQEANDTAVRYRSSSIGQLHLLYALLAQDGGFIPQVFKKMTVEPADLLSAVKAKLDGEYASHLSLYFDIKCFLGSLGVFVGDKSVVEGGTHGVHPTSPIAPNDGETVYKEDDYQTE